MWIRIQLSGCSVPSGRQIIKEQGNLPWSDFAESVRWSVELSSMTDGR
jgi:hypothetical protein